MRLNKFLAQAGVAARRQADRLITAGRVGINGQTVTELGTQVDPELDQVTLDGARVVPGTNYEYLILHKPAGYLSTVRDPFQRPTVMQLLPQSSLRLYPVGRLDQDTSGLLLFTNDGDLALALTHPRHLVTKVYQAWVRGVPNQAALQSLASGIKLDGKLTVPAQVVLERVEAQRASVRITLREGRKRQVKRMLLAIGHPVLSLQRLAMGPLQLGELKAGEFRRPSASELEELMNLKLLIKPERERDGATQVSGHPDPDSEKKDIHGKW